MRNLNSAHRLCHGSLKTGLFDTENGGPFDLALWSGVILTGHQSQLLWGNYTAHEILCDCPSAFVSGGAGAEDQDEDSPNAFIDGELVFEVQVANDLALKREVREQIWKRIRPGALAPERAEGWRK